MDCASPHPCANCPRYAPRFGFDQALGKRTGKRNGRERGLPDSRLHSPLRHHALVGRADGDEAQDAGFIGGDVGRGGAV